MIKGKYLWVILSAFFIFHLTFITHCVYAQVDSLEQIGDFGTIDWVQQKIIAKGIGMPPDNIQNQSQAKAMAERAAVTAARRNLLEVVKGIYIDSSTRVKNLLNGKDATATAKEDTIIARIEGELELSTVDDIKQFNDGAVEVTVSMPISAKLREMLLQRGKKPEKKNSDTKRPRSDLIQRSKPNS